MRVLVCGGRDYRDNERLFRELNRLHASKGISEIIQGGQMGADYLASKWAHINRIACATFWAEWKKYGRKAGPIRNIRMLRDSKPDVVVAFPGGAGTADMVRKAIVAGVPVIEVMKESDQ